VPSGIIAGVDEGFDPERRAGNRLRPIPSTRAKQLVPAANKPVRPFTSIGDRVEIRETEIEHSIMLEGTVIADLANRIEDSLIRRGVHIYRAPKKPSAYRFMLGDNSEVGIRW
jgi:NDP-sugar pyrophosphorylase family protein